MSHVRTTTPRLRRLAPALAVTLGLALTACGEDSGSDEPAADAGGLVVQDAWVRATAGTEDPSMSAAFMVIDNEGDEDVDLVSASSPVAGSAELHEMVVLDGEMGMQEVDGGITITAGRGKVLEPGGYHVMLMELSEELAAGDEVELTLEFSDGTEEALTVPVKEFTEEEGHYHDHGDHDHGDDSPEGKPDSGGKGAQGGKGHGHGDDGHGDHDHDH